MSETNGNGSKSIIGIVTVGVAILTAVGTMVTQHVGNSEEKAAIWRKVHEAKINNNEEHLKELALKHDSHVSDPDIHMAPLRVIETKLLSLEKEMQEIKREQRDRTNKVYGVK